MDVKIVTLSGGEQIKAVDFWWEGATFHIEDTAGVVHKFLNARVTAHEMNIDGNSMVGEPVEMVWRRDGNN